MNFKSNLSNPCQSRGQWTTKVNWISPTTMFFFFGCGGLEMMIVIARKKEERRMMGIIKSMMSYLKLEKMWRTPFWICSSLHGHESWYLLILLNGSASARNPPPESLELFFFTNNLHSWLLFYVFMHHFSRYEITLVVIITK